MFKNAVISLGLLFMLAAAGCSGAGQPGGLQESLSPAPAAAPIDPASTQDAFGPALPRGTSSDGIHYLANVAALQALEAEEDVIEGEGGDTGGGGGIGDLVQGIINWILGEDSAGRTIDAHESAVLGSVGFQVWRVVECGLGAALRQVSPGAGLPPVLAVELESQPGALAFATYGIKEMPAAWSLSSLKLTGRGDRFFVAVSDYQQQSWRWLGPFAMGSGSGASMETGPVEISLPAVQNENAEGFAYFTIVPAQGSELILTGIEAVISNPSWTFDPGIINGDVLADF